MGQEISTKLVRYIHYCSTGTFNPQGDDENDDDDGYVQNNINNNSNRNHHSSLTSDDGDHHHQHQRDDILNASSASTSAASAASASPIRKSLSDQVIDIAQISPTTIIKSSGDGVAANLHD